MNKHNLLVTVFSIALILILHASAGAQEAKKASNPFGVLAFLSWDHDWNHYDYAGEKLERAIAGIKDTGFSIVRFDFIWSDIEREQGKFDYAKYDRIVDLMNKSGVEISGLLSYSVDWASSGPGHEFFYRPKDNKDFINYVQSTVRRYKGKVKYWEIWNEPDSRTYWRPQDSLKSYAVLLQQSYKAIKEIDGSCQVVMGGLEEGYRLDWLYQAGAKGYFDIANFHINIQPTSSAGVTAVGMARKFRLILEKNGDGDKPIWITELGCPGVPQGVVTKNWWRGRNPDENQQAEYLKSAYSNLLKEKGVEKIFWAIYKDTDSFGDGIDYFGLIRRDFSEKPSYKALKEVMSNYKGNE